MMNSPARSDHASWSVVWNRVGIDFGGSDFGFFDDAQPQTQTLGWIFED